MALMKSILKHSVKFVELIQELLPKINVDKKDSTYT